MVKLTINGREAVVDAEPDTPLLWVLREQLGLTGTKYACGAALCGCCTVHVNGQATRSCVMPISALDGAAVTTIEGLAPAGDGLHPVQAAWMELDVAQCGYCQTGQIMQAAALLAATPAPDDAAIESAMAGNLCRCGTYNQVRQAIHLAADRMAAQRGEPSS
ncbi:MAG: (2Fe-2S)-binding protein [Pseudomonadota bacterium]|nr:(2Fe-2S)-binding protein [Pseudomonadota bacterium]